MEISPVERTSPPIAASQSQVPEAAPQQRELIQAVKSLNDTEFFGQDSELTFVMDRQSKRFVTRLVNRKTKEVIRQVPPEYALRMAEDLKSLQSEA